MAHSADRLVGSMDTVTDGRARPAESGVLVPRRCTLDGFSAEVARTGGVYLRDLDPITNLRVQTENTLYEITVPRPPRSVVLVRGGRFFPKTTEASFGGSSFGGSCLKLAWFGVGLHMEFHFAGGWIFTSRVRSIEVLDASSFPGPF
ncbi:MAG: hypothetical protein MK365_04920 [Vicinamibacterales bacterium]|jgi:hypothetical protein|nr:hypothetical protein [Vicinamibacterales bacterium]RUA00380.1 MAG: hypothetical protein DSY84_06795 [Candidatus Neomarinimicrobiota bacterium]